jgi:two-component sensor histidine kinase
VRAQPQRDGRGSILKWVGTATDVDDHKRLTEELESRVEDRTRELSRSLCEKTTLLKELHHRVKNNLQVVCSLLSVQIDSTKSDSQSVPLMDAYSRVMAMSLVHQQIYQAENLADIDFGGYVELLSGQLFNTYCIDPARIKLELNVEAVRLDLDQAVPCGLILNELLSNSLKHAFDAGREGTIRISLRKTEGDIVELEVADDGAGLPVGFRLKESPSLGLQVVCLLTEQLQAELAVSADSGTAFTLRLKVAQGLNSTSYGPRVV